VSGPGPRTAVFGYGSLADPASASRTLRRPVEKTFAASLEGWRRRFSLFRDNNASEKTFATADGEIPPTVLGLNIERSDEPSLAPNGRLIEVGPRDLDHLDVREMRYDRTDVTAAVAGEHAARFDRVIAYVAKPGHFAPEPPPGAVIIGAYARTVEGAFEALSPAEGERYRETTLPYPVPLIEGVLIADAIPEGNPRDW
jgi:cation transport regulator ChaC